MGVIQKLSDNIKRGLRTWLQIQPADPYRIQINEVMDFELSAIRNRIWYRGDGNELEQMYQQTTEFADRYKFWASRCTPGMEMRKIHTGLPGLIVRIISGIVLEDMNDFGLWYRAHVESLGWLPPVHDGQIAGTTGQKKRLEALMLEAEGLAAGKKLYAQMHFDKDGWGSVSSGDIGSFGLGKETQAIKMWIA